MLLILVIEMLYMDCKLNVICVISVVYVRGGGTLMNAICIISVVYVRGGHAHECNLHNQCCLHVGESVCMRCDTL